MRGGDAMQVKTRSGRVLSDADLDRLAESAEPTSGGLRCQLIGVRRRPER